MDVKTALKKDISRKKCIWNHSHVLLKTGTRYWYTQLSRLCLLTDKMTINAYKFKTRCACPRDILRNLCVQQTAGTPIRTTSYPPDSNGQLLELVHTDVGRPKKAASTPGYKYFVCFIDDASRYKWVFFLCELNEVASKFAIFRCSRKRLNRHTKKFCSDNGCEYMSLELNKVLGEFLNRALLFCCICLSRMK